MHTIPQEKRPNHIACIMDGNGRWAKQRGLPRRDGHRAGADAVERVVDFCIDHRIPWLTLFAFSSENWNRPRTEVQALMLLLHSFLKTKLLEMEKKGVRLHAIGDLSKLPSRTEKLLRTCINRTAGNTKLHLVLALSYGSRSEITEAARRMAQEVKTGTLNLEDITEDSFATYLDTAHIPDPDLLIRTSGEWRLSNFLLWQISYAELYITDTLWPDISDKEMTLALRDYARRVRRFGAL